MSILNRDLFKKNARKISDSKQQNWQGSIDNGNIITVDKECLLQSFVVRFPIGPDVETRLTDVRIIFSIKENANQLSAKEYRVVMPDKTGEPDVTGILNPYTVQFDNLFEYMGGNDDIGHFIGLKKTVHLYGFSIEFQTPDGEPRSNAPISIQWSEFDE